MNKEQFIKEIEKLGISLSEEQQNQIEEYYKYLIEYNNHTNLTAITEKNQFYLKHIYDSLTLVKCIDFNTIENMIDIGTGAGFPGMVIKIVFPNIKITLLDSNNKKINFLKELTMRLGIKDIYFYNGRAEEYCEKYRESFQIVTARAVSNMTMLSELCLPLVKENGYFIAMKGSKAEEIEEAEYAIEKLGGHIEKDIEFELFDEGTRHLVVVKKIKNTPKEYPRRYEKIKKNPLKKNGK